MSIKLTDTQLVLLSAASQREDRCLVASQHLKGGAAKKVVDTLTGAGLVREIRAKPEAPVWRRDEEGRSFSLKLTAAGLKAIAIDEPEGEDGERSDEPSRDVTLAPTPVAARRAMSARLRTKASSVDGRPAPAKEASVLLTASPAPDQSSEEPRSGTKLAAVIALLQRGEGATLDELTTATGWLPHTTRAALTGLRKRNYIVSRSRGDGERRSVYRISAQAARQQTPADVEAERAQNAPSGASDSVRLGDDASHDSTLDRAA